MIGNLRAPLLTAAISVVLGLTVAASAQAAEFHCSVEPCTMTVKPDGATGSKTGHHVFDFQVNGGAVTTVTCNQLVGSPTSPVKTFNGYVTLGTAYLECNVGGQAATIDTAGCVYKIKANGGENIECGAGSIKVTFGSCTVTIGSQELASGISFHNIGSEAATTTEVTVERGGSSETRGSTSAGCPGGAGAFTNGSITTSNDVVTAETHAGVMANFWYL